MYRWWPTSCQLLRGRSHQHHASKAGHTTPLVVGLPGTQIVAGERPRGRGPRRRPSRGGRAAARSHRGEPSLDFPGRLPSSAIAVGMRAEPRRGCDARRRPLWARCVAAARRARSASRRRAARRPWRARRRRLRRRRCHAPGGSPFPRGARAAARRRARRPPAGPAQPRRPRCAAAPVLRGHEVEVRRRQRRLHQPVVHPPDRDARVAGALDRPLQRHTRDLQCGHFPACAGKPDGVRALATADIEHSPGSTSGDLRHECAVRLAAPHLRPTGVPAVPLRPDRRVPDVPLGGPVSARRTVDGRGARHGIDRPAVAGVAENPLGDVAP